MINCLENRLGRAIDRDCHRPRPGRGSCQGPRLTVVSPAIGHTAGMRRASTLNRVRWCARCGIPVQPGVVLCTDCVPSGQLRQSATVSLDVAPHIEIKDGQVVSNTPGSGSITMKAKWVLPGSIKEPLRATEKVRWIADRQRYERTVWLFDRIGNVYSETCFDVETGAITWGPKMGPLTDQSLHGRGHKR